MVPGQTEDQISKVDPGVETVQRESGLLFFSYCMSGSGLWSGTHFHLCNETGFCLSKTRGSSPSGMVTGLIPIGTEAQLEEHPAVVRSVGGSSPPGTVIILALTDSSFQFA